MPQRPRARHRPDNALTSRFYNETFIAACRQLLPLMTPFPVHVFKVVLVSTVLAGAFSARGQAVCLVIRSNQVEYSQRGLAIRNAPVAAPMRGLW